MDWDKFIEESRESERQMRELSARLRRENAESRRRRELFTVRERPPEFPELSLEDRLKTFEADTRFVLAEIRHDLLVLRGEIVTNREHTKADIASLREQMATKADLASLRGEMATNIASLREQMATKAEVESLHDDITKVADGFAQVQARLAETADLLRRFLVDSRT